MPHFHHLSICNQTQSISHLFIFHQNTKAIALLFGHTCLIFITFQSAIKINQFQSWLFVTKLPRLQPYFLATNASLSSLFNLQSNSINFKCGQFSPKYQGYSLTFWPHMPHFHHFSICNQNQSISHLFIFHQNTKPIALLFGQKCLIFITFQSAIKLNQFQMWSFVTKIPRLQPYFLATNASFSSLVNLQSNSINFTFVHISPKYQGYSLTFWPHMPHFHHFSICNQNQSISKLVICHQNTKAIALLFGNKCLIFITCQSAIKLNQFYICSYFTKIPSLQPYFLAKNASFSSLFNLQSNSINFKFGHLSPKYQGYSLTFWPKMPHFHHFSICNQNQSISNLVIFHQTTKAIALLFGHKCLIFITCQSGVKIIQFQLWSFVTKIPRLQPYFLATNASFSSLFNLQSNSINFKCGHLSPKYQGYSLTFWQQMPHFHHFSICNQTQSISKLVICHQNTKAIALLFGNKCLIFITFQSAMKINKFQSWSFVTKIPRLQPYFLAKNASFSSLVNLQSNSINFTFVHISPKYQGYSLTLWPQMPHFHHFSICNQNQSISKLVICHQNTKAIALLFGQKCLIFITFQSAIKLNQFHIWSFFTKIPRLQPYFLATNASCSSLFNLQSKSINFKVGYLSPNYQGYSLTFWQQMPHCHHFSICNQTQSISNVVSFHQNTKAIALLFGNKCLIFITFQSAIKINQFQSWLFVTKIPSLQPNFLAKNASFSSLFNLQSNSINFKCGHLSPKYQGYSLTFWPQMPHFHHLSICNQTQSISHLFIFHQNTKAIALLFGHTCLMFITFQSAIKINQFQSWLFVTKIPRLQPYFLATNASFSSLVNLQSNSINFTFVHISPKYQAYSLTFWPQMPHFHHFSICNQNQSISKLVICHQNTQPIALLFGQKCLIFITFQSAIKLNQFHIWSFFTKIPRLQPYFLATNASCSSLFNLQSNSINFKVGYLSPNYQCYSLTFWPQMPHCHHFSICNQTQSISNVVSFHQNTKAIALLFGQNCLIFITFQSGFKIIQFQLCSFVTKIPRLQPYFLATNASFSSLFNLQSKSINFKVGYLSPKYQGYSLTFWQQMPHFHHLSICNQTQSMSHLFIFHQNTKPIALLFGHKCLIFITFQSAIKINQFQLWSFVTKIPRLQPYFLATNASFSTLFNLQSNSINFKFGHLSPKYQGYSLTFWQHMPHFRHFSICNQNQSMSHLVILHQNTKAIALLFGNTCLIFVTFQSAIKINQCHIWSFYTKIPRLQPYFLAKNASFSSLFNLQSHSINFNFRHFSPNYQGYSLTFWQQMPHFHHFSICNQNQSISKLVICHQTTKAIALLFGHKCLIFITVQSAIKLNQFQMWSVFTKIPRLQPYFLATNASFSSLFNLQSKSINFKVGYLSPNYQGYSLTFRPQMPHFHHLSICNQTQSISNVVSFHQNTKAIALLFGNKCLIFITFQSAIKLNQFQIWSFVTKLPRLQPYFLATTASFSSLFNLQSNSINFKVGYLSPNYQGYSLTFRPQMPHCHHFSICNQNQSISNEVICHQNTKAIALLFGNKCLIFITFQSAIKLNQFQMWSVFTKIPRLQPYFLATNASFSSLFNLQSKSINFKVGHLSPKYQGYSLTFWPQMPHFHHLSICNQTQSISKLVICHQNTKPIALLFGQKCLIFITFQSAIKLNQFHIWSSFTKIPRLQPYVLATNASFSSLVNLQSNSINFTFVHISPKYQAYSLTFWPQMPHFHHFSICNQTQSISNVVSFHQNTKAIALLFGNKCLIFITCQSAIKLNQFHIWSFFTKIPRLQPYVLATNASFSSLFNLQSKSINFTFGHFSPDYQGYSLTFWSKLPHFHHFSIWIQNHSISTLVICHQNTKAIALLFGNKCLIVITFESVIKINQFQMWSFVTKIQRLQPYFLATTASFSSLFNLQSNSINFTVVHFSPKYQAYSLTFWPQMPQFHHFSICNQNQ